MLAREKWQIETINVLEQVFAEREVQEERYGHVNDELENGTGPDESWLPFDWPFHECSHARETQQQLRADYEKFEAQHGLPTWMHLVREEVAEAFQEDDPTRLEEELIQVAALCVSWVERLRKKSSADR